MKKNICTILAAVALILVLLPIKPTFASEIKTEKTEITATSNQKTKDYKDIVSKDATILTYDDLAEINEIIKDNKKLNDNDVLKLLAEKIKDKKDNSNNSQKMKASYQVFGGTITSAEAKLVRSHPIDATMIAANSKTAENAAASKYKGSLYLDNGDAFRHAYWNALNVRFVGYSMAEQFATAHESESPDNSDRLMDIKNNKIGRTIGKSSVQFSKLESTVESYCDNGKLWRVINGKNGKLVPTNSSGKR